MSDEDRYGTWGVSASNFGVTQEELDASIVRTLRDSYGNRTIKRRRFRRRHGISQGRLLCDKLRRCGRD